MKELRLIIDMDSLERYYQYYFSVHTKAQKPPIKRPYHESINEWMIMKRPMMNALKQKWKDFIVWLVDDQGYSNLRIERCELTFITFYPNNRRHDTDNSTPKFIIDGLVLSGMIVDDDSTHISALTLKCDIDTDNPRTEILFKILE